MKKIYLFTASSQLIFNNISGSKYNCNVKLLKLSFDIQLQVPPPTYKNNTHIMGDIRKLGRSPDIMAYYLYKYVKIFLFEYALWHITAISALTSIFTYPHRKFSRTVMPHDIGSSLKDLKHKTKRLPNGALSMLHWQHRFK